MKIKTNFSDSLPNELRLFKIIFPIERWNSIGPYLRYGDKITHVFGGENCTIEKFLEAHPTQHIWFYLHKNEIKCYFTDMDKDPIIDEINDL